MERQKRNLDVDFLCGDLELFILGLLISYVGIMLVAFEFLNPEVLGIWSFCTGVEPSTTGDDRIS